MRNSRIFDTEILPEIPTVVKAHWGQSIYAQSDIWALYDIGLKIKFDFRNFKNSYLKHIIKLFLATTAYSKSLSHLYNFERYLGDLGSLKSSNLQKKIIEFIDNFISEKRNTSDEHQIWYYKSWYIWCFDLGLPYFDSDYADYLENISISGNSKGQAVMSLDEDEGPYNDQELNSMVRLLKNDLELSHGKLLAYLFLTLGVNPRNLVLLKWGHFSVIENGSHKIYLLKVPRIKKRSETIDFKLRELDQRVGAIFSDLKAENEEEDYVFKTSNGEPLTVLELRRVLQNYLNSLFEGSEIEDLRITPRRFRYTFATRLVMSGVSKERLADLLDHTDLQNVQVYFDLRHKIKGFLTEAENKKLGTLLKRFEGSIEFDNTDVDKDIKYYTITANSALGKCGSDAHCDLNAPYSCFVCPKFNAFSDSLDSYKKVYDDLLSWKKNRKEEFDENDRIQHQMDEVISALTDLISRIEEKR